MQECENEGWLPEDSWWHDESWDENWYDASGVSQVWSTVVKMMGIRIGQAAGMSQDKQEWMMETQCNL